MPSFFIENKSNYVFSLKEGVKENTLKSVKLN